MARKTKRAKIAAALRRKATLKRMEETLFQKNNLPSTPLVTLSKPEINHAPTEYTAQTKLVYTDIRKTVIVAGFLFVIEFLIFWAIEKNGFYFLRSLFVQ